MTSRVPNVYSSDVAKRNLLCIDRTLELLPNEDQKLSNGREVSPERRTLSAHAYTNKSRRLPHATGRSCEQVCKLNGPHMNAHEAP